ncbi:MAG: hypothetical protein R2749_14400 [Acidimicrobiales bacterium]
MADRRTSGHDAERGPQVLARVGGQQPGVVGLVEVGGHHGGGGEADVAAQIEAVGHVLRVGEDLRLGGQA